MRTAYRAEKYSELCKVCRVPTDYRCFHCDVPLCNEHLHLACVSCQKPAVEACKRCGKGVCGKHRPKKRSHRCPSCEDMLWELAGRISAGKAPANAGDLLVVGGLFAASIWAISMPPVAATLALTGFGWPAGKMSYIAIRRRAKAEQLRPEFISKKTPPQMPCYQKGKR